MAFVFKKLQRLLKKAATSFKNVDDDDDGYKKIEVEFEEDEKKCTTPRGYVPIYVGEERKIRYLIPTAVVNSPAFVAMLDKYGGDMVSPRIGPLSVSCSTMTLERVLGAVDRTRSKWDE